MANGTVSGSIGFEQQLWQAADKLRNNIDTASDGDALKQQIATELAETIRKNMSVDWTVREAVQAKMRVIIKRLLRKYKYPPDEEANATRLVMDQARLMCAVEAI